MLLLYQRGPEARLLRFLVILERVQQPLLLAQRLEHETIDRVIRHEVDVHDRAVVLAADPPQAPLGLAVLGRVEVPIDEPTDPRPKQVDPLAAGLVATEGLVRLVIQDQDEELHAFSLSGPGPHLELFRYGPNTITVRRHVVTEFGVANLFGKNLRERAEALIGIANPDFRGELEQAAKQRKLLP